MNRWLHLESNAAGLDTDAVLHTKLDEIKAQIATIHGQHPTRPCQDTEKSLVQDDGNRELPTSPKSGLDNSNNDLHVSSNDNADFSSILKAELDSENQKSQQALNDCVQSAHEFVSSARTVMGSRASAAGSTTGLELASVAGEALASEQRLRIEKWIVPPTTANKIPIDQAGLGFPETSILSRAERQFVEVCEEVEQLGRNGKNPEAADIGMRYLYDLWDHYSTRLREHYTSDSYQDTYMADKMHGQQLRQDLLEGQGRGFLGPERSSEGTYSVLHFFAHIGCSAEFRLLLIRTNIEPNIRDHNRKTPLIRAAHMGHKSIVADLLKLPDIAVSTLDKHGCTALDYATLNNDTDIVQLLLRHLGLEPVTDQYYIYRPFQLAAHFGKLSIMKLFVSRLGLDINHKGNNQETALHSAIIQEQYAVVQFLLQQPYIDIERTNGREETPLLCAASYNRRPILHVLLDHPGVNINHYGSDGRTPLSHIAAHGDKDLVRRLLQKGGDPDIADEFGILPIMYAASKCYRGYNRDLVYPQEKRQTPEHFALIEEFLKSYGFKNQPSEIMHRYIGLCTQRIESILAGKTPLSHLDLSLRWFEKAASNHICEQDEHIPSNMSSDLSEEQGRNGLVTTPSKSATLSERYWETELSLRNPTTSSSNQRLDGVPISWQFLLDQESSLRPNELMEYLTSIKEALGNHCSELQKREIVPISQIAAVSSEYEASVGRYLKEKMSSFQSQSISLSDATGASLPNLSPKAVIALAMLRQRPNATFVLGSSHSGKSRFIWLTCGNVQRRIKATENDESTNPGGLRLNTNLHV